MNPRPADPPTTPTVADVDPTSGAVPLAWVVPAWVLACAVLETFIVLACRVRGIGMQTPAGIGLLAAGAFGGVVALQAFITQAVGRRLRRLSIQGSPSSLLGWEVFPAADDNAPGIVADIRPIEDETRRLRDALAQSERRAEDLAASAAAWRACLPHAVLELHRDGTIASCNPAGSAMLGEAEGSLVGTKLGPRLEWPRGDELDRVLRDLIDSPGYRTQPLNDGQALRLLTVRGGSRHVRAEFAQARIQRGLQLVVVLTDVTELHRTLERQARLETEGAAQVEKIQEALNQERARAQAATRSKAAFLANMSHELRTPMNAIINLAQVARQGATGAQAATLGRVVESAQQLMDMLSDILQLARLESTSEPAVSQIVDVHECVIKVAQSLCGRAADKGLELVPWFDANVPARIPLDEAGLRQVLMNLTGNALKFTAQGHVTVRVRRLPDGERGAFLRFEVSDTGIGIPQEILQRLGQPFEQAEQASNRTFGGTGLGLALTRRVLHRMHSELQARSQPNRGSTFWFDLRLPDGQIEDTSWGLASDFETSRVLVVNDLDDARAATTTHLDALGCRAQAVGSGTEALLAISHAEAAGQPFDICVLDAEMGDIEICELAQRIRSLSRGMPPLLIALVAPGSDDKERLEVPRDVAAVLVKPCGPAELAKALLAARASPRMGANSGLAPMNGTTPPATPATPLAQDPQPPGAALTAHWRAARALRADLGMRMVRGDPVAFGRLLERFVQSHREDSARLQAMAASGQWADIHELAHALKATAGAIGALEVAALASAVPPLGESTLDASEARTRALALAEGLDRLVQALETSLAEAPGAVAAAPARTAAQTPAPAGDIELVRTLERLLEGRGMGALRFAREHDVEIRRALGKTAAPMLQAVGAFDFDKALALLRGESTQGRAARSRWPLLGSA